MPKSISRNENNLLDYISNIVKMKIEFQRKLYSCRPYENEVKLISFFSVNADNINEETHQEIAERKGKMVLKTESET